jgi:phytoene synthase
MATVSRFALPVPKLLALIDAHSFDLYDEPMATLADLERYADATAGAVTDLAARILNDGRAPEAGGAVRHAAMALTVTMLLQRLPVHAARGQRYLPDDILSQHGADAADLHAGRITDALRAALSGVLQIARRHLDALRVEDRIPLRLLPAFLPVSTVAAALARLDRSNPLHPRALPQWRRQWILWRAARDPARFIAIDRAG